MNASQLPDPEISLGAWIRARRNFLDFTQRELARRVNCSISAIRKIEGDQRRPSKQLAGLLAEHLALPAGVRKIFLTVARSNATVDRLPSPSFEGHEPKSYLPTPVTPLIGREPELEALLRMLADPECRLLTIVGVGGIGKSRLAIETAARYSQREGVSTSFVSLGSLESSSYMVPAIAESLRVSLHGQTDPRTRLLARLRDFRGLLVLDNVEHLLDGITLFADMLNHAPELKLLTTSREQLKLHGEWIFELQGLPVPSPQQSPDLEDASSVALFVQSARLAQPDFHITEEDWPSVVHICEMVGGLPLGIELAAAWTAVISCQEIADEIEKNFDILATNLRDMPERQRSLRAAFDHSWKLLTQYERSALTHLSIFLGSFNRAAAKVVAGVSLAQLLNLVAKSLVRREEGGRFTLHEVIRQYTQPQLDSAGKLPELRERHTAYYLNLLKDKERGIETPREGDPLQQFENDLDNLRAAWTRAAENGEFEALGDAMRSFGRLYLGLGWLSEGVELIEGVIERLRSSSDPDLDRVLGLALAQQGMLLFRSGRFDDAQDHLEQALAILRPLNDPKLVYDALCNSAIILHITGDYEESVVRMTESLEGAQIAGDQWYIAYDRYNLGFIDSLLGKYQPGLEQMLEALELWRRLGDPRAIALGLNHLAPTLIELDRAADARELLLESLALCEQVDDRWSAGTAHRMLGLVALAEGDYANAQSEFRTSLKIFDGLVIGWDLARSLIFLGDATIASGDFSEARRHYLAGMKLAMAPEVQSLPIFLDALVGLARIRSQEGEEQEALKLLTCIATHRSASQTTKVSAADLADNLKHKLPREQATKAINAGSKFSIETHVRELLSSQKVD